MVFRHRIYPFLPALECWNCHFQAQNQLSGESNVGLRGSTHRGSPYLLNLFYKKLVPLKSSVPTWASLPLKAPFCSTTTWQVMDFSPWVFVKHKHLGYGSKTDQNSHLQPVLKNLCKGYVCYHLKSWTKSSIFLALSWHFHSWRRLSERERESDLKSPWRFSHTRQKPKCEWDTHKTNPSIFNTSIFNTKIPAEIASHISRLWFIAVTFSTCSLLSHPELRLWILSPWIKTILILIFKFFFFF